MRERYGVEYAMLSPELAKKLSDSLIRTHSSGKYIETHRLNNTFNTSSIEKQFETYLKENNIEYIYQYHNELYPYDCDFYIPEYDLYIEIQGTWTHGMHPFDPNSPGDNKKLNEWISKNKKFYNQAVYVWTELDPKKREIAIQNKLNYLEIFSIDIDVVIEKFNEFVNK